MESQQIIVIGTSAGGLTVLNELVGQFRPEWDAAYFIVLHLSRKAIGDFLVHRLQHRTALACKGAADNIAIERGTIYRHS